MDISQLEGFLGRLDRRVEKLEKFLSWGGKGVPAESSDSYMALTQEVEKLRDELLQHKIRHHQIEELKGRVSELEGPKPKTEDEKFNEWWISWEAVSSTWSSTHAFARAIWMARARLEEK